MNLAKSERTSKRGIQAKRKLAAWDEIYLIKLPQAGLPKIKRIKMPSPCVESEEPLPSGER